MDAQSQKLVALRARMVFPRAVERTPNYVSVVGC